MNIIDKFHPYGCQGVTTSNVSAVTVLAAGVFTANVWSSGNQGTGTIVRITNMDATNRVHFNLGGPGVSAVATVGSTMSPVVMPLQTRQVRVDGDTCIALISSAGTPAVCIETGEGTD